MDSDITLQELTDAVKQISLRHSPGIDGINHRLLSLFLERLGQDFYEVAKECFENGFIPSSCRRAVLSLLPKKGDVGFLKNWRPVSVLCTDYKMLANIFRISLNNIWTQLFIVIRRIMYLNCLLWIFFSF